MDMNNRLGIDSGLDPNRESTSWGFHLTAPTLFVTLHNPKLSSFKAISWAPSAIWRYQRGLEQVYGELPGRRLLKARY